MVEEETMHGLVYSVFSVEHIEAVREITIENFYERSPLKSPQLTETKEELRGRYPYDRFIKWVNYGLSVVALDMVNGGKVIGACLTVDEKDKRRVAHNSKSYFTFRKLVQTLTESADLENTLELKPQEKVACMKLVSVNKEYLRRGIFTQMAIESIRLCRQQGYKYVTAIFASKYIRNGAAKLGFQTMASVRYDEFVYEGETPFSSVSQEHEKITLDVLKL